MEAVADWYSRNLAAETTKGKREVAAQGKQNNQAPFGMRKREDSILEPDPGTLPGLRLAFDEYATGQYSDHQIAQLLNSEGYQTTVKRPFSKETVRSLLQNRTYLGKIRYQATAYNSDGTRSYKPPVEWLEG